jgi:hypothetical protein
VVACGGGGKPEEAVRPATADPQVVLERGGLPGGRACALVTREDAEALFGRPAAPGEATVSLAGQLVSRCLWTWTNATSSQRLELHIWRVPALAPPADAEPFALGSQGFVRVDPATGVRVEWLQGGLRYALAYVPLGPSAPQAADRAAEVEALARRVAERLRPRRGGAGS